MKQHFTDVLADVGTMALARDRVIETLAKVKADTHEYLGFVSGIVSSDGDEYVERNIRRLAAYTERIRSEQPFRIFSATDVFSPELFARLTEMKLDREEREAHFFDFWSAVLHSGHVTHVFFTPRWEQSAGASDEHKTAKQLGLTITYVDQVIVTAGETALLSEPALAKDWNRPEEDAAW